MSRLMWKDMREPVLMEDYAGVPVPTPRPDLPTDVSESVTVTGIRPPDPSRSPDFGARQAPPAAHGGESSLLGALSVGAELRAGSWKGSRVLWDGWKSSAEGAVYWISRISRGWAKVSAGPVTDFRLPEKHWAQPTITGKACH